MCENGKRKIYVAIEKLNEDVLDLLALEMRSQYYSDAMDIQKKREIIKNTNEMVYEGRNGISSERDG